MTDPKDRSEEQPQQNQDDPGYNYKNIQDESMREIAENEEAPQEKEAPEEKAEDKPEEQPQRPEPKEEKEDPQKMADAIAEAVLEKQRQAQESQQQEHIQKEVDDPKAEYRKIAKEFQEKEGRPPTWDELTVKIEERTIKKVEERQAQREKEALEAQETQRKQESDNQVALSKYIEEEMEELYSAGNLTRIKDANNPTDQGVLERRSLFQQMANVNMKRAQQGLDLISSPIRIATMTGWQKPQAQPAGEDAPIAGNEQSAKKGDPQQIDYYKDVHQERGKPWDFFRK